MLRYVLFDLSLFNDGDDRALDEEGLCWLLEALTQWNQIYLKRHPETPKLYKSGVRYKTPEQFAQAAVPQVEVIRGALERAKVRDRYAQEALDDVARMCGGGEHFRDIPRIIENGGGDCFPLSQRIIVRSQSTGMYELLSLGELRFAYSAYEALSYNFSACEYEFKPIVGFVDKGMKPVSIARLSNGTDLVATDDHKFWTLNGSKQYPPYPDSFKLGVRTMGEYVNVYDDYEKGRLSKGQRTTRSRIIQAARFGHRPPRRTLLASTPQRVTSTASTPASLSTSPQCGKRSRARWPRWTRHSATAQDMAGRRAAAPTTLSMADWRIRSWR